MAGERIEFDATGVEVTRRRLFGRGRIGGFAWSEVVRVVAANTDALTHDQVWLVVETADGASTRISEFSRGFDALRAALPQFLPRADEAWWAALNDGPPFVERLYLVWERA